MPTPLKPILSVSAIGERRFRLGLVAGIGFAVCLHGVGLTVAQFAHFVETSLYLPEAHRLRAPWWGEPLWAGIAASVGQVVTLATWFLRPMRPGTRQRRAHRRAVLGASTGAMWGAVILYVFARFWMVYAFLITKANMRAARRDVAMALDPFAPYGPTLMVSVVLMLTTAPWMGIQLGYRCGRWPVIGASSVAMAWIALYALGRVLST